MNDKIEKIIKNNRPEWDNQLPEAGHSGRFAAKLDRQSHKLRMNLIMRVPFAAAAAIIIVLILLYPHKKQLTEVEPNEITEVTNYYQQQWNNKSKVVQSYLYLVDKNTRVELLSDLKSMENDSKKLLNAKNEMPAEEYISYIVFHYNTQLDRLEQLAGMLQHRKQSKENTVQS